MFVLTGSAKALQTKVCCLIEVPSFDERPALVALSGKLWRLFSDIANKQIGLKSSNNLPDPPAASDTATPAEKLAAGGWTTNPILEPVKLKTGFASLSEYNPLLSTKSPYMSSSWVMALLSLP